jgi:hypothetical protein
LILVGRVVIPWTEITAMTTLQFALAFAMTGLLVGFCAVLVVRQRKHRLLTLGPRAPVSLPTQLARLSLSSHAVIRPSADEEMVRISGLKLRDAEELLDWLEANGYKERTFACDRDALFSVTFRANCATLN